MGNSHSTDSNPQGTTHHGITIKEGTSSPPLTKLAALLHKITKGKQQLEQLGEQAEVIGASLVARVVGAWESELREWVQDLEDAEKIQVHALQAALAHDEQQEQTYKQQLAIHQMFRDRFIEEVKQKENIFKEFQIIRAEFEEEMAAMKKELEMQRSPHYSGSFAASSGHDNVPKLLTSDNYYKRLRMAEAQNGILRAKLWEKEEETGRLRMKITELKEKTIGERQSCASLSLPDGNSGTVNPVIPLKESHVPPPDSPLV
ncbi:hypothetical protein N0V90_013278 [Kalmusia sp. IMI 367209]|nr:hypothetical protein N0V90_013278 [Kalmusia sp. IMI 367209]